MSGGFTPPPGMTYRSSLRGFSEPPAFLDIPATAPIVGWCLEDHREPSKRFVIDDLTESPVSDLSLADVFVFLRAEGMFGIIEMEVFDVLESN